MAMDAFFVFFGFWIALGAGFVILIYGPFRARVKRRVWQVGTVAAGILLSGFVVWQWWPSPPWSFFVAVAVITWLNLKLARFCDACGAYQQRFPSMLWGQASRSFCSRCGARHD